LAPQPRRGKRGLAVLREIAIKAKAARPHDVVGQIAFIAEQAQRLGGVPAAIGRVRNVSADTLFHLFEDTMRFLRDYVRSQGGRLDSLDEFSRKHLVMGLREMEERDYSPAHIQNTTSSLRRVFDMLGKRGVVPVGKELERLLEANGLEPVRRDYIPELAKGWRDSGHDQEKLLGMIRAADEQVGIAADLMAAFGLRPREAVCLQPAVSWNEAAGVLLVTRGTKGGKTRQVPLFRNPVRRAFQLEVIQRAIDMSKRDHRTKGTVGFATLTLEQALERVRTVMRSLGITRDGLGITPHGLRHQFGCDFFTDRCGLAAPVLATVDASVYLANRHKVEEAMLDTSRALGHERMAITGAYAGTVGRRTKNDKRLVETLSALGNEQVARAFAAAGVTEAWVVGPHAAGVEPRKAGLLVVNVRLGEYKPGQAVQDLEKLGAAISSAMGGLRTFVAPVSDAPDGGVEILFQQNLPRTGGAGALAM
jgi:integrase